MSAGWFFWLHYVTAFSWWTVGSRALTRNALFLFHTPHLGFLRTWRSQGSILRGHISSAWRWKPQDLLKSSVTRLQHSLLLQCVGPRKGHAYSLTQLCLTLCNPMDCSLPGSSYPWDCSREENWSGLPFPPPGDLPGPGIEPVSLALAGRFFTTVLPGKPM